MSNEVQFTLNPLDTSVDVAALLALDRHATSILLKVRDEMLSPNPKKVPPMFSSVSLSTICDINKARFTYLLSKGELPTGTVQPQGRSRQFTLEEVRTWSRMTSKKFIPRPKGTPATRLAIANFKGGSTKTTTAMTTGQGVSLRGYRVLIVDLDPQASLTALFGLLPEKDVREENTIMPYINGREAEEGEDPEVAKAEEEMLKDLRYAVRSTYWDGMDIIPATGALYGAEYAIPAKFIEERESGKLYRFWELLEKGLEPLAHEYDLIIFDTPPALSYLTVNALMAADGIIMPLPPKSLDFASSTQFWSLFADLARVFQGYGVNKKYDFINVLLSNVESNANTPIIREWIQWTYDKMILPVEIPSTSVAGTSAAQFGTVYDVSKWEGNSRTYSRARQAYDNYIDLLCQKLGTKWSQIQQAQAANA